mmetsp:Transcript_130038/g.404507  ORF Transcript_130038/g.404507 Transcript_130038/m.404507 type:complete len:263 (+) Transcript_130038:1754-2542(+)
MVVGGGESPSPPSSDQSVRRCRARGPCRAAADGGGGACVPGTGGHGALGRQPPGRLAPPSAGARRCVLALPLHGAARPRLRLRRPAALGHGRPLGLCGRAPPGCSAVSPGPSGVHGALPAAAALPLPDGHERRGRCPRLRPWQLHREGRPVRGVGTARARTASCRLPPDHFKGSSSAGRPGLRLRGRHRRQLVAPSPGRRTAEPAERAGGVLARGPRLRRRGRRGGRGGPPRLHRRRHHAGARGTAPGSRERRGRVGPHEYL